jgi:hypothetical protein
MLICWLTVGTQRLGKLKQVQIDSSDRVKEQVKEPNHVTISVVEEEAVRWRTLLSARAAMQGQTQCNLRWVLIYKRHLCPMQEHREVIATMMVEQVAMETIPTQVSAVAVHGRVNLTELVRQGLLVKRVIVQVAKSTEMFHRELRNHVHLKHAAHAQAGKLIVWQARAQAEAHD